MGPKPPIKSTSTPMKESFSNRFRQFQEQSSTPTKRITEVKIQKVFDDSNQLIAFGCNNFYGAKSYFDDEINAGNICLYADRITNYVKNGKIVNLQDVQYAIMDTKSPTVVISAYPRVEAKDRIEEMTVTLNTFISYFSENNDPANNSKVTFKYLEDFNLDNEDKINAFFFLANLISLPQHLISENA